ncbi:MAG: hypothetical protein V2J12_10375 [Gammaproteobacteria bacterium]|jgi:hypothetical protein|nr:hypothetical protein [Gammaproteobacteria bacterium]
MSVLHRETPEPRTLRTEISAINREFLRLLTHPALSNDRPVLGLEPAVLNSLRRLSQNQLQQLAATPLLLVEFQSLRDVGTAEAPVPYVLDATDRAWRAELRRFADHVLTCLWQFARHNPSFVALTLGLDREASQRLAAVGFTGLTRLAEPAYAGLRARLSQHQCCWPDLVRAARSGAQPTLDYARLSLIPMSLGHPSPQPR